MGGCGSSGSSSSRTQVVGVDRGASLWLEPGQKIPSHKKPKATNFPAAKGTTATNPAKYGRGSFIAQPGLVQRGTVVAERGGRKFYNGAVLEGFNPGHVLAAKNTKKSQQIGGRSTFLERNDGVYQGQIQLGETDVDKQPLVKSLKKPKKASTQRATAGTLGSFG